MAISNEALGAAIRELRSLRGLTQSALARSAGLAANSIAVIERGERAVSMESLNSIASALKVPAGCLAIMGSTDIGGNKKFVSSLKRLISATLLAQESTIFEEHAESEMRNRLSNVSPKTTKRVETIAATAKRRTKKISSK